MFNLYLILLLGMSVSPPLRGGVDARSADGVVDQWKAFSSSTTPAALRPPLLGEEGKKTHAAVKAFLKRIEKYLDLRKDVEQSLPKPSKKEEDPAEIIAHEKQLAAGIRARRATAKRGDIFIRSVRPIFLKTIRRELASKQGETARKMILGEGNPKSGGSPAKIDLRVNAVYPSAAPLSTVPPSLLLALPELPKAVEYRFVGHNLILYDAKANLILDILPDAIR